MQIALTIAGSDSGGGAGIQADLKTFAALGVYGMSVLTAVTAQNTVGVSAVHELPPDFVGAQLDAVLTDIGCQAAKTGMLANAGIIEMVARKVRQYAVPNLVVDPVMVAKSGDPLLRRDAVAVLKEILLPLAYVVTPNAPEAEEIVGRRLEGEEDFRRAAAEIQALGPRHVIIKGGHRPGEAVDLLYDGHEYREYRAPRLPSRHTHGTGCTFSAAIAALLARGLPVTEAVAGAKEYLTRAIEQSFPIGRGRGPVHHLHRFYSAEGEPRAGSEPGR
ncbi:MAG: bifunctional hydroxymethylpyrimidine kinase/phosphomethylpyrimidine kinase [Chloroflexi bacterium]|nr:bifunctional hydroxymethylpyrimidine kinase/phosphomethylpyrimidine kinase [Chloroflexota bacterium]